jgi:23S rRNA pseudouridine1911/1915/1917 synthase
MNIKHSLSEDSYLVTHTVGPNQNGIRLDAFLKLRYSHRSREALKRAIESGAITLSRNQGTHLTVGRLKPSTQLMAGDEVLVLSERKPEPEVNFNYKVLFEDEHLFIIDKPGNLPVHPAGRYFFNTLLIHLRTQGYQNPLKAEREYFLVHRIDKETSGILVLSKSRETAAHLVNQFAKRQTEKAYLAIVHGVPEKDEFSVALAMKRSENSKIKLKMVIADEKDGGMPSHTDFRVLERGGNFSLLQCRPKTGRQHQIRVHLDAVGYPIVGDKLYGRPESEAFQFYERNTLTPETVAKLLLPRHALHSCGIKFDHPVSGQRVEFTSELPEDLRRFLDSQLAQR